MHVLEPSRKPEKQYEFYKKKSLGCLDSGDTTYEENYQKAR